MKFRYKVLFVNIIILAIGIALTGYFMIDKNVSLAMDNQVKNAITENNILQASIEYPLINLESITTDQVTNALSSSASTFTANLSFNNTESYIMFNDQMIYNNSSQITDTPYNLCEATSIGEKTYITIIENEKMYIYVCSCSFISDNKLYIISKKDISDIQDLMNTQLKFYTYILLIIIAVDAIVMYLLSIFITIPLEKLTKISSAFGNGDYSIRAIATSNDEIGVLTRTYNKMADSVEEHVDNLKDMINRQNQFIADFTHEIKTPMTSIIGYADALRSKEMSRENQIMSASYIFNEGKRLESMSRKLFDLIYTKDRDIERKAINIKDLFESIHESIKPALDAKNIKLILRYESHILNGDKELLSSALINILDNARKASKDGSNIYLNGLLNEDGHYQISIRDEGVGIAKEHVDHILDAFYMVDKSRSRQEGGAGLGLSLANTVFIRHNAIISIDSTLGEGTTFTITFK